MRFIESQQCEQVRRILAAGQHGFGGSGSIQKEMAANRGKMLVEKCPQRLGNRDVGVDRATHAVQQRDAVGRVFCGFGVHDRQAAGMEQLHERFLIVQCHRRSMPPTANATGCNG